MRLDSRHRPASRRDDGAGRGYARPYANDGRGVYAIACSFSSETATISDWLMRQVAGKA